MVSARTVKVTNNSTISVPVNTPELSLEEQIVLAKAEVAKARLRLKKAKAERELSRLADLLADIEGQIAETSTVNIDDLKEVDLSQTASYDDEIAKVWAASPHPYND